MSNTIVRLLMIVPILLFSLTFHEFAHGYSAYLMGDNTAKRSGRLTLDPLAHLDPVGTLMIIWTTLTGFGIGWAKPVPVNSRNFRNLRMGMMLVAASGPLSNLLLAGLFAIPFRMAADGRISSDLLPPLAAAVVVNVALASFNLLPIPPLDGSRIVGSLLSGRAAYLYASLERYGMFILLMLILLGLLGRLIMPILDTLGPLVVQWSGVPWWFFLMQYTALF